MRTRNMMCNANFLKETVEFFIFTTPISLHGDNLTIKLALNILLKIKKHLINIRMLLKQVDPSKFTEVINEAYIICMLANRERSRTPYIKKICSKGTVETLVDTG
jgi:hypothetical protein